MLKKSRFLSLAMAASLTACGVSHDNQSQNFSEASPMQPAELPEGSAGGSATQPQRSPSQPSIQLLSQAAISAFCVDFSGAANYSHANLREASITPNISTFTPLTNDNAANADDYDHVTSTETVKGAMCTSVTKYYKDSDAAVIDVYRKKQRYIVNVTDGSHTQIVSNAFSEVTADEETNTMTLTLYNSEHEILEKVVTAAPGVISTLNPDFHP